MKKLAALIAAIIVGISSVVFLVNPDFFVTAVQLCHPSNTPVLEGSIVSNGTTQTAAVIDSLGNLSILQFDLNCKAKVVSLSDVQAEGTLQAIHPYIAQSPDGSLAVVYRTETQPTQVIYQRKKPNDSSFGQKFVVGNGDVGGIAIDDQNNIHVVWFVTGGNTGGFYSKYNAKDVKVLDAIKLTNFLDSEPKIQVGGSIAHITYIDSVNSIDVIMEKLVDSAGNTVLTRQISTNTTHSLYPVIALNGQEDYIAWQSISLNVYAPTFRQCSQVCNNQIILKNTSTSASSVDVTYCNGPVVSWYDNDLGSKQVQLWINNKIQVIGAGNLNAIYGNNSLVHILYRDSNSLLTYTNISCRTVIPARTNTPTNTPTFTPTNTPTNTPTPVPGACIFSIVSQSQRDNQFTLVVKCQ